MLKRYLKIAFAVLLSTVTLLVMGGSIVSYCFREEATQFVIESINKLVTTRIDVESAHFSVIQKFPHASVEFRNVKMSPSRDFDTLSFDAAQSRNLLLAESVFVELNLLRLLTGNYRITRIEAHNGNIHLLTDKAGRHNFFFWKAAGESSGDSSPIELQSVTLRNMNVYYGHRQSSTVISLRAESAHLSGKFAARQCALNVDWHGTAHLFAVAGDVFIREKALELSGNMNVNDHLISLQKCDLHLAKAGMNVSGEIEPGNDAVRLEIAVEGHPADYGALVQIVPDPYRQYLHDYTGRGSITYAANISGRAGRNDVPHIEVLFEMANGQLMHSHSSIRLTELSFKGSFTSGSKNSRTTSALHINDLKCNAAGGTVKGSFAIQNFDKPQLTVHLAGNPDPGQLQNLIPDSPVASAGGQISCDITLKARLKRLHPVKTDMVDHLELQGTVGFANAHLHLHKPAYRLNRINGTLQLGNRITAKSLSLTLNGNDLQIEGYMERLPAYLLKRSNTVYLKANAASPHLCVDSLLMPAASPEKTAGSQNGNILPANIDFDASLNITKFRFQKFEAEHLNALLFYEPGILEIRATDFSSMSGKVTGKGTIASDRTNSIHVRGETLLTGIDVRNLFRSFDNFGQKAVRAEHLKGTLSGNIGFTAGWDSSMKLRQNETAADGTLELDGGELVNFEPMNSLSRFVALEELQNIRFSRLVTRISIHNGQLTLPQTDIRTSAFDITGSGTHNFDNSYTYRVKILLSELLAAKARRTKRENSENEYLEDGGKRTALYLKILGQGDNFTISYDRQSAKASVASDIRSEKQALRGILKEELGLFRKDTLTKPAAPGNTGQLRFTFD